MKNSHSVGACEPKIKKKHACKELKETGGQRIGQKGGFVDPN